MKPGGSVITLGVDDLERCAAFYRDGLGRETDGIVGTELEYARSPFFVLEGGAQLALWPRASLSGDSTMPATPPSPTGFSLGQNVGSKEAVDAVMTQAAAA